MQTWPIGRMSTLRRRVDDVLTGMLSGDKDKLAPGATSPTSAGQPEAEERWFSAPSTWDGDYVDALPWHRPKPR